MLYYLTPQDALAEEITPRDRQALSHCTSVQVVHPSKGAAYPAPTAPQRASPNKFYKNLIIILDLSCVGYSDAACWLPLIEFVPAKLPCCVPMHSDGMCIRIQTPHLTAVLLCCCYCCCYCPAAVHPRWRTSNSRVFVFCKPLFPQQRAAASPGWRQRRIAQGYC